jgi:hypothetical protein
MGRAPSHKKERVAIPKWARDQDRFGRSKKYPGCKGTFPDCPEIQPNYVDPMCKACPFYK